MTPREKALQLIDAFDEYAESRISDNGRGFDKKYCSKQCALIVVDEIRNILSMPNIPKYYPIVTDEYWEQVKKEICDL
jgi:hypothetical protein